MESSLITAMLWISPVVCRIVHSLPRSSTNLIAVGVWSFDNFTLQSNGTVSNPFRIGHKNEPKFITQLFYTQTSHRLPKKRKGQMGKVSYFNVISERDIAQDQPDKWHLFNMPATETTKRETKKIQATEIPQHLSRNLWYTIKNSLIDLFRL